MAVEVHRHLRAEEVDGATDEGRRSFRRCDAERVHDRDLLRAGLDRGCVGLLEEVGLGARRVDAEEGDRDALPAANETALRIRSSIVSRETPMASSLRSEIGDSITDARTPSSSSASTSACTAREKPHTSASGPQP